VRHGTARQRVRVCDVIGHARYVATCEPIAEPSHAPRRSRRQASATVDLHGGR
jgi:hypothetical protein